MGTASGPYSESFGGTSSFELALGAALGPININVIVTEVKWKFIRKKEGNPFNMNVIVTPTC